MLVNPEASIFSHFLTPTAVNCTLPAGSCSGSCVGTCTGLLGRCKPVIPSSKSLVKSVCDTDLRNVTVVWPLPYSAPEFFLVPAGLEAPPLLLFNAGCFRTAVLGTNLATSAGCAGALSMVWKDRARSCKGPPARQCSLHAQRQRKQTRHLHQFRKATSVMTSFCASKAAAMHGALPTVTMTDNCSRNSVSSMQSRPDHVQLINCS